MATSMCNSLGFEEYTAFQKYPAYDKPVRIVQEGTGQKEIVGHNNGSRTCEGLFVVCSNVSIDSVVHTVLQKNEIKDVEMYTSPWNAVIYSDGVYTCMGTILGVRWVVTSMNCFQEVTA